MCRHEARATYDYDAADRVTKVTYPDGTTDLYAYDRLDLASYRDRQRRYTSCPLNSARWWSGVPYCPICER